MRFNSIGIKETSRNVGNMGCPGKTLSMFYHMTPRSCPIDIRLDSKHDSMPSGEMKRADILFISRSALQMSQILRTVYQYSIMHHWSEA
uniref:Uncharacterized protein n=1 Tax=Candidatus Kentrum sp. TUN TaxID=2126343 RepID=A0A451AP73_9GAMM|nr:MAG: hypothetical protein BECKTUN1418F_GA0071002_11513 [Candidatus Kentron sp. TUN]VFK63512.1 MAG: hypothetical protein BECKTUN1418D_GA0071000_12165 [Candidatus Kentron sp. TUN]VFK67861.1 MAG: hypothetical protein BECKTUN1418E_GA0071001_11653 [Candidatus Kentron sp. TUN]